MRAEIPQGPALAPALAFRRNPLTRDSEPAPVPLRSRRQIGHGVRGIIVTNPARLKSRRLTREIRTASRGSSMKKTTIYATLVAALLVSATAWGISAAVDSPRSLMAPSDYNAEKSTIESDARAAMARCRDEGEGHARDICRAEASATERVRKADLEARYRGTVGAQADARIARVKARYDVAKVRCAAEHGEGKLACIRSARSEKAKEIAAAKEAPAT
jgi:hypothetical protein